MCFLISCISSSYLHFGTKYFFSILSNIRFAISPPPVTYNKGLKEGPSKTYHKSGALSAELNYKNDKFEGVQKYYHENGKLQAEIPTRKGVIDGVSKFYDENGKLQEEVLFKNGQRVK